MKCPNCQQEREQCFFLPSPGKRERHTQCVFCQYSHYQNLAKFLEEASRHVRPDEYIRYTTGILQETAFAFTCFEKPLASLAELKAELLALCSHPLQQDRSGELIRFELACVIEKGCGFHGFAMELQENGPLVLQVVKPHTCKEVDRNLNKELAEVAAFKNLAAMLEPHLSREKREWITRCSVEYRQVSSVYKMLQNELHALEDEAMLAIWELPCRWRRGRGETNQPPGMADLERLAAIVQSRNFGKDVMDYVQAQFYVTQESGFFQQRGYFLLLCCAAPEILQRIWESRIQVMLYARNLLDNNMFLLCRQRLNLTMLRNHIWMIILLSQALRAVKGESPFPLMGITAPKDSEMPIDEMLASVGADFFRVLT